MHQPQPLAMPSDRFSPPNLLDNASKDQMSGKDSGSALHKPCHAHSHVQQGLSHVVEPSPYCPEFKKDHKPSQPKFAEATSKSVKLRQGYVDHVGEKTFVVIVVDLDDEYQHPLFQVEFEISELSVSDQKILVKDSIIQWDIRVRYLPNGKQEEFYKLDLIKFAPITKEVLDRAQVKTDQILKRIKQAVEKGGQYISGHSVQ